VTAEKVKRPSEADVSPYLLQPLRTLEQARRDRKRQQRRLAPAKAKMSQPGGLRLVRSTAAYPSIHNRKRS
jgi:hypothetical protein